MAMAGLQFSTLAESEPYRKLGIDVNGMPLRLEAKLARQAKLFVALVCIIVDFDNQHHDHTNVEASDIIWVLEVNVQNVGKLL